MKYALTLLIAAATVFSLASCKKEMASEENLSQPDSLTVTAEVLYRERILAPQGSTLTATIEDVSIADKKSEVLSEEIIGLADGVQLPLKVTLQVPQEKLKARHTYAFRARLEDPDGQLMWTTTSRHTVKTDQANHDLGTIVLQRVESGTVGAKVDKRYPIPFKASGNEPGWLVKVDQNTIEVQTNYGENTFTTSRPIPQPYKGGYKYHLDTENHTAIVDVYRKLCYDDMSGRPLPARVLLTLDGETYQGCGGDPLDLLTDVEWVVEDIDNKGIIDSSRVTINFDQEGRAFGISSCNSYSSAYEMTGETLTFKAPMGTLKACAPALMNQEQRFLKMLAQIVRYDIDGFGALILTTKSGKTIIARQQ